MEMNVTKNKIELHKELSTLDCFVIDFISILNSLQIRYVIVSGYVSILFGRNRISEDIDLIVEKQNFRTFTKIWNTIFGTYECLNATDTKDAYEDYLVSGVSLRFAKKNTFIPNIEFKFPKIELDIWTLEHRKNVVVNDIPLYISPLELQIPFKLFLGSQKDIEDAKYLYTVFQPHLNVRMLQEFNRKLKTQVLFKRYIV